MDKLGGLGAEVRHESWTNKWRRCSQGGDLVPESPLAFFLRGNSQRAADAQIRQLPRTGRPRARRCGWVTLGSPGPWRHFCEIDGGQTDKFQTCRHSFGGLTTAGWEPSGLGSFLRLFVFFVAIAFSRRRDPGAVMLPATRLPRFRATQASLPACPVLLPRCTGDDGFSDKDN